MKSEEFRKRLCDLCRQTEDLLRPSVISGIAQHATERQALSEFKEGLHYILHLFKDKDPAFHTEKIPGIPCLCRHCTYRMDATEILEAGRLLAQKVFERAGLAKGLSYSCTECGKIDRHTMVLEGLIPFLNKKGDMILRQTCSYCFQYRIPSDKKLKYLRRMVNFLQRKEADENESSAANIADD